MMGITGLRLLHLGAKGSESAPSNLIAVQFPKKTTVTSMQMVDGQGRPTYRKDIKV